MSSVELVELLVKRAKEYRADGALDSIIRNNHMHNNGTKGINETEIDAVLTDFVNFVGIKAGVDLALYASDLAKTD